MGITMATESCDIAIYVKSVGNKVHLKSIRYEIIILYSSSSVIT